MYGVFSTEQAEGDPPLETYGSGAEANTRAQALSRLAADNGSEARYRVKPVVDDSWKERERARLAYGEYTRLPSEVDEMAQRDHPEHYAHASKSQAGKVAFTESAEKGSQDRQTRKRAGAYLREYWPDLSDSEVQRLALICDNEAKPRVLEIATEADDFERIYTDGPTSCMGYDASDYQSDEHPVRAYAGYDLAIGWIEGERGITGRAVLWPDQMRHATIYGDVERMRQALADAGYSSGSLDGAKMSKLENSDGSHAMPYIDGSYNVSDCGSHFEIDSCGDTRADSVEGVTRNATCTECGCSADEGYSVEGDAYCCDCVSYCEDCNEYSRSEDMTHIDAQGIYVCESCRDSSYTCCDECYEWIADDQIVNHDSGSHCQDCFPDLYDCCANCGESVSHEDVVTAGEYDESYCADCAEEITEDEDAEETAASFA